jgi:hypothetical protein
MMRRVDEMQQRVDAEQAVCTDLSDRITAIVAELESARKKIRVAENLTLPTLTSTTNLTSELNQ